MCSATEVCGAMLEWQQETSGGLKMATRVCPLIFNFDLLPPFPPHQPHNTGHTGVQRPGATGQGVNRRGQRAQGPPPKSSSGFLWARPGQPRSEVITPSCCYNPTFQQWKELLKELPEYFGQRHSYTGAETAWAGKPHIFTELCQRHTTQTPK